MHITATPGAAKVVHRVIEGGRTNLVMVIGTGCCDSTAPFLYDNYIAEPGSQEVGEVEGVTILAPAWLTKIYKDDGLVVDVYEGAPNDSLSLESEYDCRFTLRLPERPTE